MAMFVLYSASNAFQWTQLVIITSILEKYYSISTLAVYWTSMIYMVLYIPLIFPASWLLDKKVKLTFFRYFLVNIFSSYSQILYCHSLL